MNNIETKWLDDFLTLEAYRNFSQAAEARNLSQSAFSRRILALEESLGVKLFNRLVTPLQLTEEGKLFHSQARNILRQLQLNLDELLGHRSNSPNIKFAAAHSLSLSIMPKLIQKLSLQSDKFIYLVESIDVDETIITLLDGKCDFIFSFYDEKLLQEPFLYTEILESKIYPVTLKDAFGNPLFSLDDAHLPLLNYTLDSYMGRLVNRKLVQYPQLNLQTKFISSMSELLKNMVLNGQGIAWLPEYSIINELKDGKLMILNDKEMSIPIKGYVYRMNTRLNSYAEQFWEFLKGMESIRTMIK
ncbi:MULTISPECIES: hypochlorite stress DNA-binding transcriptional regulator HypT [Pasteurellaceae]|uniref:LysR substrate binding domain protein n=1 Tax=Pasteurella bettyae CCUG 2042 TaxID=1095749 RepID=I3DEN7_9PAST|nr:MULTISPECIES: hypochlorite stress DNA-binding transcriptional regulator HypT [Pasteurellaceae]EIJ70180.1 LysR substrate binding domain protein [Pasteurella bettyae CCUG 2042]SUB21969.1 hydrogen peroxide-inducible genes activator [Pasteurella bettyae]